MILVSCVNSVCENCKVVGLNGYFPPTDRRSIFRCDAWCINDPRSSDSWVWPHVDAYFGWWGCLVLLLCRSHFLQCVPCCGHQSKCTLVVVSSLWVGLMACLTCCLYHTSVILSVCVFLSIFESLCHTKELSQVGTDQKLLVAVLSRHPLPRLRMRASP